MASSNAPHSSMTDTVTPCHSAAASINPNAVTESPSTPSNLNNDNNAASANPAVDETSTEDCSPVKQTALSSVFEKGASNPIQHETPEDKRRRKEGNSTIINSRLSNAQPSSSAIVGNVNNDVLASSGLDNNGGNKKKGKRKKREQRPSLAHTISAPTSSFRHPIIMIIIIISTILINPMLQWLKLHLQHNLGIIIRHRSVHIF